MSEAKRELEEALEKTNVGSIVCQCKTVSRLPVMEIEEWVEGWNCKCDILYEADGRIRGTRIFLNHIDVIKEKSEEK